jgi:hypothetical protein
MSAVTDQVMQPTVGGVEALSVAAAATVGWLLQVTVVSTHADVARYNS